MDVVSHPAVSGVAQAMARDLAAPVQAATVGVFPDGEPRVRAPAADVLVVDLSAPGRILESLLLLDAQRQHGRRPIVAVPYLGLARQDRAFEPGEPVSVRVLLEAISRAAAGLVVLDPHKESVLAMAGIPAVAATAVPELAEAMRSHGVDLVLAPDAGARERAAAAAKILGCAADVLEKVRASPEVVEHRPSRVEAKGRTVAIVDDIISTGGTMASAAQVLLAHGARAVHVAATHGVFVNDALGRLRAAGAGSVTVTDSRGAPSGAQAVSAGPALARAVRALQSRAPPPART